MNVRNFELNDIFRKQAKCYQTKPVKAAKYLSGMENGFVVYYRNKETKDIAAMLYEGMRFFHSEEEAIGFVNSNEKQYVVHDGKMEEIEVIYDSPEPVLYRKYDSTETKRSFPFREGYVFESDESMDYEFCILCLDSWIIEETDGTIRVWYQDSGEPFFGYGYVCEKLENGDYLQTKIMM